MYSIMYSKTNTYFNFFCLGTCFICITIKLRLDYEQVSNNCFDLRFVNKERRLLESGAYSDLSISCAALIRE